MNRKTITSGNVAAATTTAAAAGPWGTKKKSLP